MSCNGGNCSCGKKGRHSHQQENLTLVQMSESQEIILTHNFTSGLESLYMDEKVVEVRFKNNRKAFYRNSFGLRLQKDDRVVVEAESGHDLGTISLTGEQAQKQFDNEILHTKKSSLKRIRHKATKEDLDLWIEAKRKEREVLMKSRGLAAELHLEMSIRDVEFQGDGKEVNVFYSADRTINTGELVRKYESAFGVKVEMKALSAHSMLH